MSVHDRYGGDTQMLLCDLHMAQIMNLPKSFRPKLL